MVNPDSSLILAHGVGFSLLGSEGVLLDQTGQLLRGVNVQGAYVLSQLNGRCTVAAIGAATGDAQAVSDFIAGLYACGLLIESKLEVSPTAVCVPDLPCPPAAPAVVWEQRFVGLQLISDPCLKDPPPGLCP